jgi:hypothetical protein
MPPIIDVAPEAVATAANNDGFTPVSQTRGFKTVPLSLATATTMAPLTVLHGPKEAYNFSESSDEEDSPPLPPNQPTVTTRHGKDPSKLIAAIAESKHHRNLAFIENVGKVNQISCRARTLMESTRLIAESMFTNTAAFTARLDGMNNNLAAIKRLLEESMASSAKLVEENATAMKLLSAQALLFNEQRFKQGQAAFHWV